MHLDLRGHPLHTRSLSITLTQRADGRLDAHAEVVDLRKRGFVPVAGELQPSGVVHHMLLDGEIDPRTAVLDAIALRQPSVAFEATAVTYARTDDFVDVQTGRPGHVAVRLTKTLRRVDGRWLFAPSR